MPDDARLPERELTVAQALAGLPALQWLHLLSNESLDLQGRRPRPLGGLPHPVNLLSALAAEPLPQQRMLRHHQRQPLR